MAIGHERGTPTAERPLATGDGGAATIGSYFLAFSPAPSWDDLVRWPPDVFALTNLVLDHTEAYRFAVAPPTGRHWPPVAGWNEHVRSVGRAWRAAACTTTAELPDDVLAHWAVVTRSRDVPMADVRAGTDWELCDALLTLHAMADEACACVSLPECQPPDPAFQQRLWAQLAAHASLSRLSPARVRVMPKTHFATRGITIRSFSRYLALCYESVDVRWQRTEVAERWAQAAGDRRDFNLVLVPWPERVRAEDFRSVEGPLDNMDRSAFGFFEFAPAEALSLRRLDGLLQAARRLVPRIDGVVLPEVAIDASEIASIEGVLAERRVSAFISGVRDVAAAGGLGQNRLHLSIRTRGGWWHLDQAKHHRWCLDESQIRQYHLSRSLDPHRQWWEAIDLPERQVQLLDMGGGTTVAPLICEDLARLDEVADVLRRIGPSLVIGLLLDGPQLTTRWPARYATVLADEPGSAVLTLTSLGMATRSHPPGTRRSRVVALWNDTTNRLCELELAHGSSALLITATVGTKTSWTADGRRHDCMPDLGLSDVRQLRAA